MTNATDQEFAEKTGHRHSPLTDLLVSIVIPSIILMKLSDEDALGVTGALVVALAFPLLRGAFDLIRHSRFNYFALIGLVSITLTGGIGLLQLDVQWLAVKEAAIPGLIALVVLASAWTRHPLIKTLLFNTNIFDETRIQQQLKEARSTSLFEARLVNATYMLGGTFLFSALVNYMLASWIVSSPTGSAAFNEELGRLTLLSYPMIAIPSTLMMMAISYYIWRTVHGLTGLTLKDMLKSGHE